MEREIEALKEERTRLLTHLHERDEEVKGLNNTVEVMGKVLSDTSDMADETMVERDTLNAENERYRDELALVQTQLDMARDQVATLCTTTVDLKGKVDRYRELLAEMLLITEHGWTVLAGDHQCGNPNSQCDYDCVARARDDEVLANVREALGGKSESKPHQDQCDCQDPENGGISNYCHVHNENPYPRPETDSQESEGR